MSDSSRLPDLSRLKAERHGVFVVLRPITPDDAAVTLSWRQSARARLLNAGARTVAEQAAWIAARPAGEVNFILETAGERRPFGMLSLVDIDLNNQRAEPARFLIGDEDAVRGQPVSVEAMALLYELAFDELGLRRLYGTIAAENTLMLRWQLYFGMTEEGRLRSHTLINGRYQDIVLIGMMDEEYRRTAKPRMAAFIAAARARPAPSCPPPTPQAADGHERISDA